MVSGERQSLYAFHDNDVMLISLVRTKDVFILAYFNGLLIRLLIRYYLLVITKTKYLILDRLTAYNCY